MGYAVIFSGYAVVLLDYDIIYIVYAVILLVYDVIYLVLVVIVLVYYVISFDYVFDFSLLIIDCLVTSNDKFGGYSS